VLQIKHNYSKLIEEAIGPLIPTGAPVAFFDFSDYSNVGDSAIFLGEVSFLQKHSQSRIIFSDSQKFLHNLPKLPPDTIILIHGGGNFGDLWINHQIFRLKLVKNYTSHRIIQFPQSIHFDSQSTFEETRNILALHPDFHLFVRDNESLSIGRRLHTGHSDLCPDMALYLRKIERPKTSKQSLIFALMRTDKEKMVTMDEQSNDELKIKDWIDEPRFALRSANQVMQRYAKTHPFLQSMAYRYNHKMFKALASHRLRRGCNMLSSGHIVITDRLHAHILCSMMSIPHVILDNSYRKIGNFRDVWQTGQEFCETAQSFEEALRKARKMVKGLATRAMIDK
jgi:pyruvyl transferase EpsO